MKKIYLSLLSITTAFSLNAQTLNQSNHAPASGDSYNTTVANGAVSPGTPGAGQSWNYASITVTASPVTWSGTTNSNTAYSAANVKMTSTAGDNFYFESTAASLKYYGGDIILSGIPVTLTYTSPAIYAVYPMALNTATTNMIGGTLVAAGLNGTFSGTCNVMADATGTLSLPGRSFNNVIRVATMQDIRMNVPMAGVSNGTLTQVNYEYYQVGYKQPMFTISTTTVDAPPAISASNNTVLTLYSDYLTVNVKETSLTKNNVVVYPNPASGSLNFVSINNENIVVKLFSLTGSLVKEVSASSAAIINVSDLQNGLYIYTLTSGEETITGKIAVTH